MTKKKQVRNPFIEYEEFTDLSSVAQEYLGMPGKMLYRSKSRGKPTTIFNVNVFDRRAKKIWFGDLEVERDREALLAISKKIGPLYVLYEMDGRFLEFRPTKKYIELKAIVTVADGNITYSKDFAERAAILIQRAKAPKKNIPDVLEVESGEVVVGRLNEKMAYHIYHSPGNSRKGRDYMALTPCFVGGSAFGKTAENTLRALKRLYTIHISAKKSKSKGRNARTKKTQEK
ncbi:MAG: hypothetical protein M0Z61_08700 [Nitrospiraceae bacterium]|nr:hypothetical protein [Nitrospiraceae bacterium]